MLLLSLISILPQSQGLPPIYQDTIIVDINGNGDYTSLKEAVENADSLTHIKVRPGTYHENSFTINKKIAITGVSPDDTIIDFDGQPGITVNNSYVEIHHLQIIDTIEHSIIVSFDMDYCNISNLVIFPNRAHGIILQSSNSHIYNCEIYSDELTGQGIKVRGDNNKISYCSVEGFGEGIMFLINSNENTLSNCNTYGNDVGFDIRINSKNNIIKNSNIYANEYGVYIWQNSNQNKIYNNNFWKNDIDAVDENNNDWYLNGNGNFWDDYTGKDSNDDGIGDTPYTLSDGVIDEYPLIEMILPSKITTPTSVEVLSNSWDNTPMFTWSESLYNKNIKGYYVKIDQNEEEFTENTFFTVENPLSNGAHTFYVKAEGADGASSNFASIVFSVDTTFIDSDGDGWSDKEEQEYETDPQNPDNYPLDTDNDHLPDSEDTDDDNDGYSDLMEQSYNTNPKNPDSKPLDTDNDGVPDEDSPDGKYTGDLDDDDDYLIDAIETRIGSNPKDATDTQKIYIKGKPFYLVDTTQNNEFNILYHPDADKTTDVQKQGDNYLIDKTGDNKYDYLYNPLENTVNTYSEKSSIEINPLILLNIILISIAIILVAFYIKTRQKKDKKEEPLKEEKIQESKLSYKSSSKETLQMFGLTKNLLENMQKEISIYMDQLNKIENQMSQTDEKQQKTTMTNKTDEENILEKLKNIRQQVEKDIETIETDETPKKISMKYQPKKEYPNEEPMDIDSKIDILLKSKEKEIKTANTMEEKIDEILKNNNL